MKYLSIRVDNKRNWKADIDDIAFKLIRANAMLCKVRDFNNAGIFKAIMPYLSHIFIMHHYMGTECLHNHSSLHSSTESIKERTQYPYRFSLFQITNGVGNCLLIGKYVNNKLPLIFHSWFAFSSTSHNYETSFATNFHLEIPTDTATTYSKGVFISTASKTWNNIQSQIKDPMINTFSPIKLKFFFSEFYLIAFSWIWVEIILVLAVFFTFLFFFYLKMTAKGFWLFGYQLTCSK